MKKRRLEIDEIRVETFTVADQEPVRGTVHANAPTYAEVTCSCACSDNPACSQEEGCTQYRFSCEPTWCAGSQCLAYC